MLTIDETFLIEHGACSPAQDFLAYVLPITVGDTDEGNLAEATRVLNYYKTERGGHRCMSCDLRWLFDEMVNNLGPSAADDERYVHAGLNYNVSNPYYPNANTTPENLAAMMTKLAKSAPAWGPPC